MKATIKISKKLVFQLAWKNFKNYKMTFSQALVEAWKSYRKDAIKQFFRLVDCSNIELRDKLVQQFNSITKTFYPLRYIDTTPIDNSGAAAYYGCGRYNGD